MIIVDSETVDIRDLAPAVMPTSSCRAGTSPAGIPITSMPAGRLPSVSASCRKCAMTKWLARQRPRR